MILHAWLSIARPKLLAKPGRPPLLAPALAASAGGHRADGGGGERITVVRRLADARAVWQELAARSRCYVFQTYEYVSIWNETVGTVERVEPFIVFVADRDGRIGSIFPLGIRRRYGCRILVFLGGDQTDYNAPLFDPEFAAAYGGSEINRLWNAILLSLPPVDIVWLRRMPEKLPDIANPMVWQTHARLGADSAHAASPLPTTFAAFVARSSAKYFSETRRMRRRLEDLGPLTFDLPGPGPEVAEIVNTMLRQKRRHLQEIGMPGWQPHIERFYRALAEATIAGGGRPVASCLRVGGEIVATNFGATYRKRFCGLVMSYERGHWARYSPGRVLLQFLVEWCISEGIETFDLTLGDEGYKRFWANSTLKLYESFFACTLRGACFMAAFKAVVRLRAAARRSRWLRSPVAAVRNKLPRQNARDRA